MKKQAVMHVVVQAGVIATMILPASLRAESYSTVDDLVNDTSKVESVLNGGSKGSPDDLVSAARQAKQTEFDSVNQTNEVLDLAKKNQNWVKKIDKLSQIKPLQDTIIQKALQKRDVDLKKLSALSSQLNDSQSFVNPQDFNTSNLPKACKRGVDFSQTRQLLDQMNSEPGQYLSRQLEGLVNEKLEDNKKARAKKIADAFSAFRAAKEQKAETLAKAVTVTEKDVEMEKLIAKFKESNKQLKETSDGIEDGAITGAQKFFEELAKVKDNDDRVQILGREFAKSMETIRKQTRESSVAGIEKLFSNCKKEKNGLVTDIEVSKAHITNYLVQAGTDPVQAAQTAEFDAQAQRQRAASLGCEDVTERVDFIIQGGQLTNILNRLRSAKSGTQLAVEAASALSEVRNIQAQVGQELRPLIDDCQDVAESREALKTRVAQIAGNGAGAVGSTSATRQAGVARTGGARSTGTTH
jgi:hypothetical protein